MNGQVRMQEPCGCVQGVIVPTGTRKGKFIIYKVTNQVDGKVYIGQTVKTLERRKTNHIYDAKARELTDYFHNAIRKYGLDGFLWETICLCPSKDEADAKEREFIKAFDTKAPLGYNLTDGGEGCSGFSPSEETLAKMRGHKYNLGKKHSEETKAKMSKAHMGCRKCLGYKHSDETKAKVSNSLRGNKRSLGYKHSSESRAINSKAQKLRWATEKQKKADGTFWLPLFDKASAPPILKVVGK